MTNKTYLGETLQIMSTLPDQSVDLILADLPYGTVRCKWDVIIPFEPLWEQYNRLCKGAVVLFASEPFTSVLITSNLKDFKYRITWDKMTTTNHLNSKKMPLRQVEDICVFYKSQPTYNPIKTERTPEEIQSFVPKFTGKEQNNQVYGYAKARKIRKDLSRFLTDLIQFNSKANECNGRNRVHPTQKPVELLEYLIKTYTNEGDLVLDNVAGSGSTGVACQNSNRNYILIEQDKGYYQTIQERLCKTIPNT